MLKSNAPTQLTVAFASGAGAGPINAIPIPASGTAGAASWTTGFTAVNMEPIGSGGIPPFGADFNGLFNALSNAQIWEQAGYLYPYSSAFSTAVGGYPAGASLQMASGLGLWINLSDSNTTNPDTTASANWVEMCANGGATSIALSGASVTPTANQLGVRLLILTGALSAACKLVLPLRNGASWKVLNSTTGGQTVTVGGATGSTVTIAAGSAGAQEVFTDGTNYYTTSFNGSGVYLPVNGNAVSASKWANARAIAMIGDVVWSVSVDGSADATAAGTIQAGAITLAKMANLTASTLLGNPTGAAATPVAIPLVNGLQFTAGSLGMGNITPTSVTVNGVTSIGSSGAITINTVASNAIALTLINTSSNGAQISLQGNGSTTPNKTIRAFGGLLQVVNSAGTAAIYSLDDTGAGTFFAGLTVASGLTIQSGLLTLSNGQYIHNTYAGIDAYWVINPIGISSSIGVQTPQSVPFIIALNNVESARVAPNGVLTLSGQSNGNGAQLLLNGNGGTTPTKTIRARAGALEFVNSANTAIIWSCDDAGDTSQTGTLNFGTSDATLKDLGEPIEPNAFHRLPYYAYTRTDTGAKGWGPTAQDVRTIEPAYVREYDHVLADGSTQKKLHLAKEQITQDTAFWAARQIDAILGRLERAGI